MDTTSFRRNDGHGDGRSETGAVPAREAGVGKRSKTRWVLSYHRLDAWWVGLELVKLTHAQPIGHAELRNQSQRASVQAALGVGEGAAHDGAAKKRHYRLGRGSAMEVVACYELADAIGEKVPLERVQELGGRLVAILTRLVR